MPYRTPWRIALCLMPRAINADRAGAPSPRCDGPVYLPGVGVGMGVVSRELVVDSTGVGEGEATGELSGFGEGDGLAFAVLVSFWHDAWENRLCRCPLFPVYFRFSLTPCRPSVRWPVRHAQLFGPFLSRLSQWFCQFFLPDLDRRLALREDRPSDRTIINAKCLIVISASVRIKSPRRLYFGTN